MNRIYSDADIIEKAIRWRRLAQLRRDNYSLYQLIRRRGLLNAVRTILNEPARADWGTKKDAPKPIPKPAPQKKAKPAKKKAVKKKAPAAPKPPRRRKEPDFSSMKQLYKTIRGPEGNICGRCMANKTRTQKAHLCSRCHRLYRTLEANERDHVPHNIRQKFCNTKIAHHEKTFIIGIVADAKTQAYLTAVGYAFIFQEPWEDPWTEPDAGISSSYCE